MEVLRLRIAPYVSHQRWMSSSFMMVPLMKLGYVVDCPVLSLSLSHATAAIFIYLWTYVFITQKFRFCSAKLLCHGWWQDHNSNILCLLSVHSNDAGTIKPYQTRKFEDVQATLFIISYGQENTIVQILFCDLREISFCCLAGGCPTGAKRDNSCRRNREKLPLHFKATIQRNSQDRH